MAKFRYIGDHQRGDCLGYQFPRNISAEVTNPVHVKKLEGNKHFQRMDTAVKGEAGGTKPTPKPAAPAPKPAPESSGQEPETGKQESSEGKGEAGGDGDQGTNKVAGAK